MGPSRPTQLRFRGFVGFHSRRAINYFSLRSEITELRKCVDPRNGSSAIPQNWLNCGPPCPTQLRLRGFVGFHSRRATNYFSRNYEITKTRGPKAGATGHFPTIGGNGGLPSSLSCVFAASLAFIADAPQIIFLEIPKLRNTENL